MLAAPPSEIALAASAGGVPRPDRSASANWSSAGMLFVRAISRRTELHVTVNPMWSGQDDTTNIQNTISVWPCGQVVQLGSGVFTVAEGNYVLLKKGMTQRGAWPGITMLQRTNSAQSDSPNSDSDRLPMAINECAYSNYPFHSCSAYGDLASCATARGPPG